MTSSTSSSGRAAPRLAAALLLAVAAGCAHPGPPPQPAAAPPARRMALFPLVNLTGRTADVHQVQATLEEALLGRGLEVVSGDLVAQFLARHRVRYTGGIDGPTAGAAREELGVEAVLLGSLDLRSAMDPPAFAATMRLVSTADQPEILWMDGVAMAGDEQPGFLNLGLVRNPVELERQAVSRLVGSLEGFLAGRKPPADTCPGGRQSRPRSAYAHAVGFGPERVRVAVVPFANDTGRRDAGEVALLALVRQLVVEPGLKVFEPGVVRAALLDHHVVLEGGVTHEAARIALGVLEADVVVAGRVHVYDDVAVPVLEFSATALSTRDNRPVWQSTSFDRGDAGVYFFEVGKVSTTNSLLCGVARSVAQGLARALRGAPGASGTSGGEAVERREAGP